MKRPNLVAIGDGLQCVHRGLKSSLRERLQRYYGDDWWERGVKPYLDPRDRKSLEGRPLDERGELLEVEVFLGNWRPVFEHLSPLARDYAFEVHHIRNRAAHWRKDADFPLDDAIRALDTMKRLLRLIGAQREADECKTLRRRLGGAAPPPDGPKSDGHVAKILHTLERHGPRCDGCLSMLTEVTPRQTVNQVCRRLEQQGKLTRAESPCSGCNKSKIVSRV